MAFYAGLVDHRGHPIEKQALTQRMEGPTLTGVRSPLTGYPSKGLTPPILDTILREADHGHPMRYYELAEQIEEKDHHYAGVLATRKRSVSQLEITVDAASDDAQHQAHAELIRTWLKRDELQGEIFDMLDAIGKGESFTYINWDTSEGQWQPRDLDRWDQRWFRPKPLDLETPMLIDEQGVPQELPPGAFIHLVARGKSGIPARSGIGRLAAWFWLFKGMTSRDWAIYTATYGQPLRVGKYGPNASEEEKDTLFRAVANIAGDCAAIIPNSMVIEFQQPSSSTGTSIYKDRADWLDQQMSKAVLGQTTTTDAISGGHAVSQEHRQVQEDIERADARVLSAAINRDLVLPWIMLEFGPQKAYPRLRIGRPEEQDVNLSVDVATKLGLPIKKTEAYSMAGLSIPEPTDEVIVPPRQGGVAKVAAPAIDPNADPALNAIDPGLAADQAEQDAIDALTRDTGILAGAQVEKVLELIGTVVATSSSLEEVRSRLLQLAPTISTKGLALALRQAQVVAKLTGRAELADG